MFAAYDRIRMPYVCMLYMTVLIPCKKCQTYPLYIYGSYRVLANPTHASCFASCLGLARTIYTVYIRYFWQGNHRIYGHIRCIYTVLANPSHVIRMFVPACSWPWTSFKKYQSYTVHIYIYIYTQGSCQPYSCFMFRVMSFVCLCLPVAAPERAVRSI